MALIYNIEDYRNRKQLEERITKLALGQWISEDERIHYMIKQAEKDLEEWEKLYPIKEIEDISE